MNKLFKSLIGKTKYTVVLVFFLVPHFFVAQNDFNSSRIELSNAKSTAPFKTICFGESIKFNKIDSAASWKISLNDLGLTVDLKGLEINSYVFDKPGNYEITFTDAKHAEESCDHSSIPEKFNVLVSPTKMEFDFSTLKFNKKIEAGIALENIEMTLIANVKIFNNEPVLFDGQMVSAGIGTTITGKLIKESVLLKPGTNNLTYKISGSATKDTYIMFDFFDINNQVQPYYFPTKL